VEVRLFRKEALDGLAPAGIEIAVDGASVLRREPPDEAVGLALYPRAAIAALDDCASIPSVIFASYGGGMRCCWTVSIFAPSSKGWSQIDLEEIPGLADYSGATDFLRDILRDIDGDGNLEIVDDHEFYGLFCDDGGVSSPLRIRRLSGGKLVDVSRDPKYLSAHWGHFARLRRFVEDWPSNRELPGLVASARLVGEGDVAWEFMLKHYEDPKLFVGVADVCWPDDQLQSESFPKGLELFLAKNGYGR
jgi:hypothetical protein